MSLSDEERQILVKLEIEKAYRFHRQALLMQANEEWDGMANRLYYALYHAVAALLIFNHRQVTTHKGSHALFNQYYVKTGILPKSYGSMYSSLERMREECDYNCAYTEEPDVLQSNITPAKEMIDTIATMVKE